MKVDERKVIDLFVKFLKQRLNYDINYWKNYVLKAKEIFPRSPDIDLIICRKERGENIPPLRAFEVKYIRSANDNLRYSYYEGLDEALALLAFGFDEVSLIHIVEEGVLSHGFLRYTEFLSSMIKALELPIGYYVYSLVLSGGPNIHPTVRRPAGLYNLEQLWVKPPKNPLLELEDYVGEVARKNRNYIVSKLDIKERFRHGQIP